jgi:hypothetical protein
MRQLTLLLLMTLFIFLSGKQVLGSYGGVTNVGPFVKGAGDTGSREWVELTGNNGLLSGKPKHKNIKLITVYAPGIDKAHLILREIVQADGRKSLLISTPDYLSKVTVRATIFIKSQTENLSLAKYVNGQWAKIKPQSLRVDTENSINGSQDNLFSFSVSWLGAFMLYEGNPKELTISPKNTRYSSANELLGGDIYYGMLPLVTSILLLAIGWITSRLLHKRELNIGK